VPIKAAASRSTTKIGIFILTALADPIYLVCFLAGFCFGESLYLDILATI
jgi:hypothetical protein